MEEALGLDRSRVAELIVSHAHGERRASGYLVRGGEVLTAAHALADAVSVRVRFEPDLPGQREFAARSWETENDVALVRIDHEDVPAVAFGRIGVRPAVLAAQAVGFPRWKLRFEDGSAYRDACHAHGSIAVLSNWREDTLELTVPAPADVSEGSPWEGMSGAAVWVGDRIVGIVAKHHRSDGPGRLTAARVDRANALLSLGSLTDAVPPSRERATLSAYEAELHHIAPDQLDDRVDELAELVRFCAGDDRYFWWQAGPWAGKSALLSWFVLHAPANVDTVSFFITSRFAGQSDSDAYTDALIEQLATLVGESPQAALESKARHGHALRLLTAAATRAYETDRRLLLVVDGLDEDTSRGIDRPSIASLLPRKEIPGLRVLVASRPHPDLPPDVPGDHPLRAVTPRRLSRWQFAQYLENKAISELHGVFGNKPLARDVLGLMTASGGGLTFRDLEQLTGRPPYALGAIMQGPLGRSLDTRAYQSPEVLVYIFAHETLRAIAVRQFGSEVEKYRAQLHAWADRYAERGWPSGSPAYLLRGYSRMLATTGDIERLLALVTDRRRLDRKREHTGGDASALNELSTTYDLLAQQRHPDFHSLLSIAVTREELYERNRHVSRDLPATLALRGQTSPALAIADSIPGNDRRAAALAGVAAALVVVGDADFAVRTAKKAERLARDYDDPYAAVYTLATLAIVSAARGDTEKAGELAAAAAAAIDELPYPWAQDPARICAAVALSAAGLAEPSAQMAATVVREDEVALLERRMAALTAGDVLGAAGYLTDSNGQEKHQNPDRGTPWRPIVAALAEAGDISRAVALAADDAYLLSVVAGQAAIAGKSEQAAQLAVDTEHVIAASDRDESDALERTAQVWLDLGDVDRAERVAESVPNRIGHAAALGTVAARIATAGGYQRAQRIVRSIGVSDRRRAGAMTAVALALAKAGQLDRAADMAVAAEDAAREVESPFYSELALGAVATVWIAIGDLQRAEALAESLFRLAEEAPGDVTAFVLALDKVKRSDELIAKIADPDTRSTVAEAVAIARAAAGAYEDAERLLPEITSVGGRVRPLAQLAASYASAGDRHRASSLAAEAKAVASAIVEEFARAKALARLAAKVVDSPGLRQIVPIEPLLAEVLGTNGWHYALKSVAVIDLPALQRVADHLIECQ
ncbi:trypsin-like peptidase domain-containing protein [Fodinicola acaciae]|uniref:trypsin-like peptidase domain-containing protein n=1 Tax=Fodinicola acaciae TaxID=2681555 RepID=UPI0013D5E41D|nr:trypsin-like peptidase domain-containing protein [Fodinicola acaciae]